MSQTALDRLRFRGEVSITADADGYSLSWWPKGQRGNPFCARGVTGPVLDALAVDVERATRPDWYPDVESVREARERKAEYDRACSLRQALALVDREDRWREKRDRQRVEWRRQRQAEIARRERSRVQRVLTGSGR